MFFRGWKKGEWDVTGRRYIVSVGGGGLDGSDGYTALWTYFLLNWIIPLEKENFVVFELNLSFLGSPKNNQDNWVDIISL